MFKNTITLTKNEEIRIVLDPYRNKIMEIFRNHKEPLTVQQLAKIIGDEHGKVYYHVKKLFSIDLLEVVKTESINGILAKYYNRKYDAIYFDGDDPSKDIFSIRKSIIQLGFSNSIIDFKKDVVKNIELFGEDQENIRDLTYWRRQYLYLTPEEYEEVRDAMRSVYQKYLEVDESKDGYAVFIAITRVK